MTLASSGPVSIGDIIAETAHCKGSLSKQGEFVSDEKRGSIREFIAPNFIEAVDQFGRATPWKDVGLAEFHSFDGYKDNNYIISDGSDGSKPHNQRETDVEAFVIIDDVGRILRTDDKTGSTTVIKHENRNDIYKEDIFLYAEFCREFGTPDSKVYFYFTNSSTINNLHSENSFWPAGSKVIISNINAGSCNNPNLGAGEHVLL